MRWNPLATDEVGFDKGETLAGKLLRHVASCDWHNERKNHGEDRMRFFQAAARIERLRHRMVATGQLIDVTGEAQQQGLLYAVYLSNRLWKSLVRPYPFAEAEDCVSLVSILGALQGRLNAQGLGDVGFLLLMPPYVPGWFRGPCYLKYLVNRPPGTRPSVLVQPHGDPFPVRPRPVEDSLPASLVVHLAATLHFFSLLGRNVERSAIEAMQRVALELARETPFYSEIVRYLDHTPPTASKWLSSESNRASLLAKLDELLGSLEVCAERNAIQQIEWLRRNYRVLVSPLAQLAELTEGLLRLAARVPNQQGPIRYEPFRPLLSIYVEMNSQLKRLETVISYEVLSAIEFQISLMAEALPSDFQDALGQIEQELHRLLVKRYGKRMEGLDDSDSHIVVWH